MVSKDSIFAISGMPPEQVAYTMASYSRSNKGFKEISQYVNENSTKEFMEKFYIKFGHGSIADLASVPIAIERISMLAAEEVLDGPLWSGMCVSSRYRDLTQGEYIIPRKL